MKIASKLWAKKNEDQGRLQWLSLAQHLNDTQNIIVYLWDHWLNQGQRRFIVDSLSIPDEEVARNLVRFLGATHDVGKATPAFQTKKSFSLSGDLDYELLEILERDGFTGIHSLPLAFPEKSPHTIAGESILLKRNVNTDIVSIIGSHHGQPTQGLDFVQQQASFKKNYYQSEDLTSEVAQKWDKLHNEILEWALEISEFGSVDDLPEIDQPAQVLLSGLLITSDWIASNERYFPLNDLNDFEVDMSDERAQAAWKEWFKTYPLSFNNQETIDQLFESRFKFTPRPFQRDLLSLVEECDNPGIFIIEAPMGLGKTEAALAAAELLAVKKGLSGTYFGLPTQATSNGIFPRIKSWLDNIAKDYDSHIQLRLSHGKAALNENFSGLSRYVDADGEGSVYVNEWFNGRKTATLDDFVVGTVDQLLLMSLKQRHLALRHLGFSKKVVIIDEVHAYDAYMSQYLLRAVEWLSVYNVPVIILSATLPDSQRIDLVKCYLAGQEVYNNHNLDVLKGDIYPLITYTNGERVGQIKNLSGGDKKTVHLNQLEEAELMPLITKINEEGAIAGVVVNTVKRAQHLAKLCVDQLGEENVSLLHFSFIATDRAKKESNLLAQIGKEGSRPAGHIVIGTQVIEQSLDIDFDVMISDLAPMDLLIQRVGRLHRHMNHRPKNFEKPILYVLGISKTYDFEPGSKAVYGDYLLIRTQELLPAVLEMPQDISRLVQATYSKSDLCLEGVNLANYQKAEKEFEDTINHKKHRAEAYLLKEPKFEADLFDEAEPNLWGWLNRLTQDKSEEKAHAQVRDSQETIEVIAVKRQDDGYSLMDGNEDISNSIEENKIGKNLAQSTLKLPNIISRPYNIDQTILELEKYNAQSLPEWQNQSWLKGKLGIIFDENNQFKVNGFLLTYDNKLGLMYEKEDDSGKI